MKSNINGFNRVASIYDVLAGIVFGGTVRRSQEFFLGAIADKQNVLILGGGTGWILESMGTVGFSGEVFYIEASSSMLDRSRLRATKNFKVHFIHGTEQDIPDQLMYDAVITNFFMDLFPNTALPSVIAAITRHLQRDAVWLATDFTDSKSWWHQFLLRIMYFFFRTSTSIQSNSLPDWEQALHAGHILKKDEKNFYKGFIKSTLRIYQSHSR